LRSRCTIACRMCFGETLSNLSEIFQELLQWNFVARGWERLSRCVSETPLPFCGKLISGGDDKQ